MSLEKLLEAERKLMNGLPSADDLMKGVLRFPANPQSTMLEGDAQRNVPAILKMAQAEMRRGATRTKASSAGQRFSGGGKSLPLSRGMMTFPYDQIVAYKRTFD